MTREEIFKKIKKIRLEAPRKVTNELLGNYHSAFRGQGMVFSEIRSYVAGDDVRNIAWIATARNRKLYVKDFKEDRTLNVIIAVDSSSTMEFWSKTPKTDWIAEIAASICYSALRIGDKIGGVFFGDKINEFIVPKSNVKNLLSIVDKIISLSFSGNSNFFELEKFLEKVLKETSLILLFSDFLISKEDIEKIARNFRKLDIKHEVIPIVVNDKLELGFPDFGFLRIKGIKDGMSKNVFFDSFLSKKYAKKMQEQREFIKKTFSKNGMEPMFLNPGDDYVKKFAVYFKKSCFN